MTAIAHRPPAGSLFGQECLRWDSLEEALAQETDLAEIDAEYAAAVAELVDAARAEARAAGAQYRLLYRMWQLAEEAREQRWMVEAHWLREGADRIGPGTLEPEEQTLHDVADEIGPALRLPASTAMARVRQAVVLGRELPRVLAVLEAGDIGIRQATVIVELWQELTEPGLPAEQRPPAAQVHQVVTELLARARQVTAAQLGALARRRKARLLAATEEARHRVARADRRVWVEPLEDGMAQLGAVLDAATAWAIRDRLDALAHRMEPVRAWTAPGAADPGAAEDAGIPGVPRTLPQRRADVLTDLLLDGEPADWPERLRGVRGRVTVTVPALTLLERTGTPGAGLVAGQWQDPGCAELAGYGPVPAGMAAWIAAAAPSWTRVLTHPITGVVLDHDRTTYAVPTDLRRRLADRDGTCRFPGCRRIADRCELDHTLAWAEGGTTAADNLAHLCPPHHRLKHRHGPLGPWRVRHAEPPGPRNGTDTGTGSGADTRAGIGTETEGVLEWTSPAGQVYRTHPQEHRTPDHLPDPPPF